MTSRAFEKTAASVLASYKHYTVLSHKVWKEDGRLFLSVRMGAEKLRPEPWGVSVVFDADGKLIRSSCGSLRDSMFTRILMKKIEDACRK